jgi:hypothetical protein
MLNTTQISVDENSHFMEFLRVLDASIGVQDINILLFVDKCASQLQDINILLFVDSCASQLQDINILLFVDSCAT